MDSNLITLVILVLLLYGLYQLWSAWQESNHAKRVEMEGISAQAEITDRWSARGRVSAATHYVIYTFNASEVESGEKYQHQQQVNASNYDRLTVGMRATIKYLVDDPEDTARLSGEFADKTGYSSRLISGLILIVVTSVMLVLSLRG